MRRQTTASIATLAVVAAGQALVAAQQMANQAAPALPPAPNGSQDLLDDLSLEELLELRENILQKKQKNLTYVIEETDDDDDDTDDDDDDFYPYEGYNGEEVSNEENADDDVDLSDDQEAEDTEEDDPTPTEVPEHSEPHHEKGSIPDSPTEHEPTKHTEKPKSTTENLLALREGLIAEIQEHMQSNNRVAEDGLKQVPNLNYDLMEGPVGSLKGSMLNEAELSEGYESPYLSLMQDDRQDYAVSANAAQQQLDTNVMYDPLSGEGLVCVNGRCISNKRKFQVHEEREIGLRSGDRRRGGGKGRPQRRKRIPRHNGIPMNPYEQDLEALPEDEEEFFSDDDDQDYDDLVPFEGQDLSDGNLRDGKIYNASGLKPQEPQKPQTANLDGSTIRRQDMLANKAQNGQNGPIASQLTEGPSFKPGQPFSFSTANNRPGATQATDTNKSNHVEYVAPLEVHPVGSNQTEKNGAEEEHYDPYAIYPQPHRANLGGAAGTLGNKRPESAPVMHYDTSKTTNLNTNQMMDKFKNTKKQPQQKETEFPALFCDEGDCTLGQSHTGVACVWNHCVSTFGEEMAAEMCQGEECWDTTDNILCVDDYCHVIEADFVGFRGVPCAGGVCGYEAGISICNLDKCTFTSEDGLSFAQGEIDINGVVSPCEEDPILCAGHLCACVDPNQHFETDLLGMESAGTMNCDGGKCQMSHHQPEQQYVNELYPEGYDQNDFLEPFAESQLDPYGYSPQSYDREFFKPSGAVSSAVITSLTACAGLLTLLNL